MVLQFIFHIVITVLHFYIQLVEKSVIQYFSHQSFVFKDKKDIHSTFLLKPYQAIHKNLKYAGNIHLMTMPCVIGIWTYCYIVMFYV
jgi:hypothetical protein